MFSPEQIPEKEGNENLEPDLLERRDGGLEFRGLTLAGLQKIDELDIKPGSLIVSNSGTIRKVLGIDRIPHANGGFIAVEKTGVSGVGQQKIPFRDFSNTHWIKEVRN